MKIHGTAKGGALSKKDFGVAFSASGGATSEYDTTTFTNNDDNNFAYKIYSTGRYVNASEIISGGTLDGVKLNQMKCLCQKIGSPNSSTIYGRIFEDTNDPLTTIETSTDTYNTDDITTGDAGTELTFNFSGDTTLAAGNRVGIYASIAGGTNVKAIGLRNYQPRTTDNAVVTFSEWNPDKWEDDGNYNLWQQFTYTE